MWQLLLLLRDAATILPPKLCIGSKVRSMRESRVAPLPCEWRIARPNGKRRAASTGVLAHVAGSIQPARFRLL